MTGRGDEQVRFITADQDVETVMKPSTLSRRADLLGVGVLTPTALAEGTTAFAGTETHPKPAAAAA